MPGNESALYCSFFHRPSLTQSGVSVGLGLLYRNEVVASLEMRAGAILAMSVRSVACVPAVKKSLTSNSMKMLRNVGAGEITVILLKTPCTEGG
jgi:hypothetical protein